MENVAAGSTININRSDGRVHQAVVVAVNQEAGVIRVEWFENGETKGKDIDFKVVRMLNPNIALSIADISTRKITNDNDSVMTTRSRAGAIPRTDRRTNLFNKRVLSGVVKDEIKSIEAIPEASTSEFKLKESLIPNGHDQEITKQSDNKKPKKSEKLRASIRLPTNGKRNQLAAMIAEYRAKLKFHPLSMADEAVEDHLIAVCVRKRPLNKQELNRQEVDIVTVPRKNCLIVHEPKTKVDLTKYIENHNFCFDYAFDEHCNNAIVYKYTAQPLVKTIFEGGYATCFAYGQTGSGKTHTMSGDDSGNDIGIYALAISDVFKLVSSPKYRHMKLSVSCSFFEIYGIKVLDLLNKKALLKILEDGKQQVQVVGLRERFVARNEDVMALISEGNALRTSGQTSANANSSRSHAVFQIYLKNNGKLYGKLSLIDLAGNERGADTFTSDRQTRLEGGEINKSLLALKECIRALGRKGAHLPFRVSKLTQVLRDSFVGNNSRTCMIAMVSPGVHSSENTLNTLRYADRVKELGSSGEPQAVPEPTPTPKMEISTNDDVILIDNDESNDENDLFDSEEQLISNVKSMVNQFAEMDQILLKMQSDDRKANKKIGANQCVGLIDKITSNLLLTKSYLEDYQSRLD